MREFLEQVESVWSPHPGQREFLLHPAKFKVLACGRRWGKTDACAFQIVQALHRPWPTKHLILGPTADQAVLVFDRAVQLMDHLAQTGSDGVEPGAGKVKRSPHPHFRFGAHTVMARSGHLPRALRGHEATHIVVDEAAYLPESLITEVAMPMLATTDGYLTLVSTPHGKNHFWRFFEMGQRGENGVWSRQAPSAESPFVSDSFLEVQKQLLSERAFGVEYEARFMDSAGQVFKTDAVQACLVTAMPTLSGPFVVGVDWARYGDYTTVAVLSGNREEAFVAELQRFQGTSWSEAVLRVAETVERYPHARILCDQSGVGDPVVEQLQKALPGLHVQGLVFTNPVKVGLINNLSWLIERQVIKMRPDPQLMRELEHFEAKTTDSGNTRLAARGGYHDDLVVALALASDQLATVYRPKISVGKSRTFSSRSTSQPINNNHEHFQP